LLLGSNFWSGEYKTFLVVQASIFLIYVLCIFYHINYDGKRNQRDSRAKHTLFYGACQKLFPSFCILKYGDELCEILHFCRRLIVKIWYTCLAMMMWFGNSAWAASFTLASPPLKENSTLPPEAVTHEFGCKGPNISPRFVWENPPEGTKSFALTMYDPDAPTASGWWHWTVYNIPANVRELPANSGSDPKLLPPGAIQGRTDIGKHGYTGVCPTPGDEPHHYKFTLYALKTERIELNPEASAALLSALLIENQLATATLVLRYGRPAR